MGHVSGNCAMGFSERLPSVSSTCVPTIFWFRRDLRLSDHPALLAAAANNEVIPLFVLDPALINAARITPRWAYLLSSLHALKEALARRGAQLILRTGNPVDVLTALVATTSAEAVHVSADFSPYGVVRDRAVEEALAGIPLVRTSSPYAVAPGSLQTGGGTPYRVFTPFYRAWRSHGWCPPAGDSTRVIWADHDLPTESIPEGPNLSFELPPAGEAAALETWHVFKSDHLKNYESHRDRPDLDHTSRISAHLKLGEIHPRTMLADLGNAQAFTRQLAWRDFYASILYHWPESKHLSLQTRMQHLPWRSGPRADRLFEAWGSGHTGYPFVDAGMRQLAATGWMHNRLRMITASFLVKDLHIDWVRGAEFFLAHLIDGDVANNQHGWQWVAGTGTDAAPFFRIFNPVTQGKRFDPNGDFITRWVPELTALPVALRHEPWRALNGRAAEYVDRIVDHAAERAVALADYAMVNNFVRDHPLKAQTGGYLS